MILKYAKVGSADELKTVQFQTINPERCPHLIFSGEHYRPDGSCLCDDPSATVMAEWGYVWNPQTKQWDAGKEED